MKRIVSVLFVSAAVALSVLPAPLCHASLGRLRTSPAIVSSHKLLQNADFAKISPNLVRAINQSIAELGEEEAFKLPASAFVRLKGIWIGLEIQQKFGVKAVTVLPNQERNDTIATVRLTLGQVLEFSAAEEVIYIGGARRLDPNPAVTIGN